MRINTKYKLDDVIWQIRSYKKPVRETCTVCEGSGRIQVKSESYTCPECRGVCPVTFEPERWHVGECDVIGQVRAEITKDKRKIAYMCNGTGIGSGSVWQEDRLYPTRQDAQYECDKRNGEVSQ